MRTAEAYRALYEQREKELAEIETWQAVAAIEKDRRREAQAKVKAARELAEATGCLIDAELQIHRSGSSEKMTNYADAVHVSADALAQFREVNK